MSYIALGFLVVSLMLMASQFRAYYVTHKKQ